MKTILYFVVVAAVMLALARVLPGFVVTGWGPALIAAVVLAVANAIVRPILFVLTLPFVIVTLGLFLFVINAITLWIAAALVPGFAIRDLGTALVASLLLSVLGLVWKSLTHDGKQKQDA